LVWRGYGKFGETGKEAPLAIEADGCAAAAVVGDESSMVFANLRAGITHSYVTEPRSTDENLRSG
jgi:hypothetical protein